MVLSLSSSTSSNDGSFTLTISSDIPNTSSALLIIEHPIF